MTINPNKSPTLNPVDRRWRRSTKPGLTLWAAIGLSLAFVPEVQAHCTFTHPDHCVMKIVTEAPKTVTKTIDTGVAKVETTIIAPIETTVKDVEKIAVDEVSAAGKLAERGYNEAKNVVENVVWDFAKGEAIAHAEELLGKIAGLGKAISETSSFPALAQGVQDRDAAAIASNLDDVLYAVFVANTDSEGKTTGALAQFEDTLSKGKIGSLMLTFSGGAAVIVGVDGDIGLAVEIAYIKYVLEQFKLTPNNPAIGRAYEGSLGSLFVAIGGSLGLSVGGGGDWVWGYHAAPPSGVGGPSAALGLQVKIGGGTGASVGWDISGLPWKLVTAGVAFGVGVEVDLSGGASYGFVVQKICNDGTFRSGVAADYCKGEKPDSPASIASSSGISVPLPQFEENVAGYVRMSTLNSSPKLCFDNDRAGGNAGGNSMLYRCANTPSQYWRFEPSKHTGYYRLKTQFYGDNRCIDTDRTGRWLIVIDCGDTSGQYWQIADSKHAGHHRLKNMFTGADKCLDGISAGEFLVINPCTDANGQNWKFDKSAAIIGTDTEATNQPSGSFKTTLHNVNSSLCVGVANDGVDVIQDTCGAANQTMTFFPVAGQSDVYTIAFDNSGKCLDVVDWDGNGANATQYSCNNGPNQQFKVSKQGSEDTYTIVAQHLNGGGRVLDISAGSTSAGASVFSWPSNGYPSQKWRLAKEF